MRTPVVFTFALSLAASTLAACGGPTPPADAPAAETPAPASDMPAAPETSATPAADAAPAKGDAAAKGGALTSEDLQKKKSLDPSESPFPEIAAVTKDLGAPAKSGKAKRVSFWYDLDAKSSPHCSTVDLVETPSGGAYLDRSVTTTPDCKKIKATQAKVHEALDAIAGAKGSHDLPPETRQDELKGKKFADVVAAFEKKVGKPQESGEPEYGAWKYVQDETCRYVVVTSHLGSNAGQAIWDVPCE